MQQLLDKIIGANFPVRAPAKINLRLKILGRRADSFHLLSMLNACVNLYDEIAVKFTPTPGITTEFDLEEGEDPLPEDNSVTRSCKIFLDNFFPDQKIEFGIHCFVKKVIPTQAGLGGGTSDAASVLKILGMVFGEYIQAQRKISSKELLQELARIGLLVGADVPYLLYGGLAAVSGIGEQVMTLRDSVSDLPPVLLGFPEFGNVTSEIFQEFRIANPKMQVTKDLALEAQLQNLKNNETKPLYDSILGLVENDLLQIVTDLNPDFKDAWNHFSQLSDSGTKGRVGMTGSGSTMFFLPSERNFLDSTQCCDQIGSLKQVGICVVQAYFL